MLPLGVEQLCVVQPMGQSMQSAMGVQGRSGQSLKNIIIYMFICAHALVRPLVSTMIMFVMLPKRSLFTTSFQESYNGKKRP